MGTNNSANNNDSGDETASAEVIQPVQNVAENAENTQSRSKIDIEL